MQSIGKTILLELPEMKDEIVDGIIIPKTNETDVVYFKGIVHSYGTGWSKEEVETLNKEIPINSIVYFNWKSRVLKKQLHFINKWYMILPRELILAKDVD